MNAYASPLQAGWSAQLDLEFQFRGERTVLARNRHQGPLRVQRPFYPESLGQCHVYLLHPPGGVVAGDSLHINATVESAAHALITTPSAGRVYRTNEQRLSQSQQVELEVKAGAFCEWLPQENIVFDNAQAINRTRVDLHPEGCFIGWEVTCLGRPASDAAFESGSLEQSLELYQEGVPLLLERNQFLGGSDFLQARWGLHGAAAIATLVCSVENGKLLQQVKALCQNHQQPTVMMEATQLPGLMVVRALAPQAEPIKNAFIEIWKALRRSMLQSEAVAPRIWYT